MGKAIPVNELKLEDIDEVERAAVEDAWALFERITGLTREEAVLRDILPKTDLNLTNEVWTTGALTANAWTDWIKYRLPREKLVCFTGGVNNSPDPAITAIGFRLGPDAATTKDIVQVEQIYVRDPIWFFDKGKHVIYKPGDYIFVNVYAKRAVSAEPQILKGFIIERRGEIISGSKKEE